MVYRAGSCNGWVRDKEDRDAEMNDADGSNAYKLEQSFHSGLVEDEQMANFV